MNSASKVGEIFTAAGAAFNKLAELTLQLHPNADTASGGKWTEEDIDMLQTAIVKFNEELSLVSDLIKKRTVSQLRTTIRRKAFEDAGLPLSRQTTTVGASSTHYSSGHSSQSSSYHGSHTSSHITHHPGMISSPGKPSAEVTLNMLNSSPDDMDVVGGIYNDDDDVRLDFVSSHEEVP
uniref:Putative chromatin complex subunit bap18-like isoform 4 n=2 Tax=Rhodnius TaxID=13248 RepID=A0A0P4VVQ9_9HEMI